MTVLVTGGAGFIGSCAARYLLENGETVKIVDNLSTGRLEFIEKLLGPECTFFQKDILDTKKLAQIMDDVDTVWHLAANPDIRAAEQDTMLDLKQGMMGTHSVLEAMRMSGASRLLFSSSSVVYGEAEAIPTPENYGPLKPISLYGAAKLGAEGLITAYSHAYGLQATIYRFANIVGRNQTHGVAYDFINKLHRNPERLDVLGDGKQAKSYLLVEECVEAMHKLSKGAGDIYNLGGKGRTPVSRIAEMIRDVVSPEASIRYLGGDRGWTGDVRQMELSLEKARQAGWQPSCTSDEAMAESIRVLLADIR